MRRAQVPMTNIYTGVPHGVGFGNGGATGFTGNNGFVTPSEDEFDDFDDDTFLLAASQQVERQMTQHDSAPLFKDSVEIKQELLSKQGEIKVLRDKLEGLIEEKRVLQSKHFEQLKDVENKYKKDNANMSSKLAFKDRDIAELQAKLLERKSSQDYNTAKRPRLHSVTDHKALNLQKHRLRGFRVNRSNVLISTIDNMAINEASSPLERAMFIIQRAVQESNNVRVMFGLNNNKFLPNPTRQCRDHKLPLKIIHHLISTLRHNETVQEQKLAASLLVDLAQCKHVQSKVCDEILEMLKEDKIVIGCVSKILASVKTLDVWNKCNKSEGCPLKFLYKYPNKNILRYLYNIIYSIQTVHTCVCTKQMVKFVAQTIIQCVEEKDSVSYRCGLVVLRGIMPHFTDLDLASTTQTLFHQALYVVQMADVDSSDEINFIMYNVSFDPNMSLGD